MHISTEKAEVVHFGTLGGVLVQKLDLLQGLWYLHLAKLEDICFGRKSHAVCYLQRLSGVQEPVVINVDFYVQPKLMVKERAAEKGEKCETTSVWSLQR